MENANAPNGHRGNVRCAGSWYLRRLDASERMALRVVEDELEELARRCGFAEIQRGSDGQVQLRKRTPGWTLRLVVDAGEVEVRMLVPDNEREDLASARRIATEDDRAFFDVLERRALERLEEMGCGSDDNWDKSVC